MGWGRSAGLVLAVFSLAACERLTPKPAAEVCAGHASERDGSLVASFDTTVGAVVRLAVTHETAEVASGRPHQELPRRFTGLSPDGAAILCYIDEVSIGIPYQSGEPEPRPWDRLVIAVVDGTADVVIVGYSDKLPVAAP